MHFSHRWELEGRTHPFTQVQENPGADLEIVDEDKHKPGHNPMVKNEEDRRQTPVTADDTLNEFVDTLDTITVTC